MPSRRSGASYQGQGRKELRFRFPQRQANSRRSLRRQKAAHRLSLHVRPGVEGRLPKLSPRAYGPRNLMKVAGVATKWKRNVAATQALNPLLSVALSRLSTLLANDLGAEAVGCRL